jgi:phosphopantetheine adenylyltransferase
VETVFIMAGDQYALTSSSLIRQVVALGGDVKQLRAILPDLVVDKLQEKHGHSRRAPVEPDAPAS